MNDAFDFIKFPAFFQFTFVEQIRDGKAQEFGGFNDNGLEIVASIPSDDASIIEHFSDDPIHIMRVFLKTLYYGDLDKYKSRPTQPPRLDAVKKRRRK